jgi:hydroxymethylbilane synthase
MSKIRIGTRGSPLALAQAHETRNRLIDALGVGADQIEIKIFTTTGDEIRDRPLSEIGGKGLFTKELEEALFAGAIDLAVHSMKDVPAQVAAGLEIAAYLPREDVRDAFISLIATDLKNMPQGGLLGSSSVRRSAQALRIRSDLKPVQFRGNVQTRLQKLHDGKAQATFLALAGLKRLGLQHVATQIMNIEDMLPAVAQGAIGIQIRQSDDVTRAQIEKLNHAPTAIAITCERAFMAVLNGSCRTPIAGHATLENGQVFFKGEALTLDGKHVFSTSCNGPISDAFLLGKTAGQEVKAKGGKLIAF